MNLNQNKIQNLLKSLVNSDDYEINAATPEEIAGFNKNANQYQVEQHVIDQLVDLYGVANQYNYEIVLAFHNCTDIIIFEWWNNDEQELWLGQRDSDTLRWANGKFCLGDASNISYSDAYEFDTLIELIEGCIKDIEEANYFGEEQE